MTQWSRNDCEDLNEKMLLAARSWDYECDLEEGAVMRHQEASGAGSAPASTVPSAPTTPS